MNELIIKDDTSIDRKLVVKWQQYRKENKRTGWTEYIETIGEGIIRCERLQGRMTSIEFESPEHITWFILRWS